MKKRGITLIESIVSLAILGLAITGIFSAFSNGNALTALDKDAYIATTLLDQARSMTLGSKDNSEYGVWFEERRLVLFKGETFSPESPDNLVVEFNRLVEMSGVALEGGGSEIVFNRLSGETDEWGSVTLSIVENSSLTRVITIHKTGLVEINYE